MVNFWATWCGPCQQEMPLLDQMYKKYKPAGFTLIGVNVGPNLTYVGSLATLLWRRIVHSHDEETDIGEFTLLGLLTVTPSSGTLAAGQSVTVHLSVSLLSALTTTLTISPGDEIVNLLISAL